MAPGVTALVTRWEQPFAEKGVLGLYMGFIFIFFVV
jgi:hypothetical protein